MMIAPATVPRAWHRGLLATFLASGALVAGAGCKGERKASTADPPDAGAVAPDPASATSAAVAWANQHHRDHVVARHRELLRAGDRLSDGEREVALPAGGPWALFWIDPDPYRTDGHRSSALLVSPDGAEVHEVPLEAWPVVNGDASAWGPPGSVDASLVVARTRAAVPDAGAPDQPADAAADQRLAATSLEVQAGAGGLTGSCSVWPGCEFPTRYAVVVRGWQSGPALLLDDKRTWWDRTFRAVDGFLNAAGATVKTIGDFRRPVSVEELDQALSELRSKVRCCDEVILWFLAHGSTHEEDRGSLLLAPGAAGLRASEILALVRDHLWNAQACKVMVVVDASASGTLTDSLVDQANQLLGPGVLSGRLVAVAGQAGGDAAPIGSSGTAFAQRLQAITGGSQPSAAPWPWETLVGRLAYVSGQARTAESARPCCACEGDEDCMADPGVICHECRCVGGECIARRQPPGAPCDDQSWCTVDDRCVEEPVMRLVCRGSAYACPERPHPQCGRAVCNEARSIDAGRPLCDLAPDCIGPDCCEDGDLCTTGELCDEDLNCVGGRPVQCPEFVCHRGYCNPQSGDCDYDRTTVSDAMMGLPICCLADHECGASPDVCQRLRCSDQHRCVPEPLTGGGCDDGDSCTIGDACAAGVCRSGPRRDCNDDNACTSDSCAGGTCIHQPESGTPCDDGDACTRSDACVAGRCEGSSPVSCAPSGEACRLTGACDPATGQCAYPAASDGTACDDGLRCTTGDRCAGGACVGSAPSCAVAGVCQQGGGCDPATGQCLTPLPAQDGTACDDGDPCTTADTCVAGRCAGTRGACCLDADCADRFACTADTCDGPARTCSVRSPAVAVDAGGAFDVTDGSAAVLPDGLDPDGIVLQLGPDWTYQVSTRAPVDSSSGQAAGFWFLLSDPAREAPDSNQLPGGITHDGVRGTNTVLAIARNGPSGWQVQAWTWDASQQGWVATNQGLAGQVAADQASVTVSAPLQLWDPCATSFKLLTMYRPASGNVIARFVTASGSDPLGAFIVPRAP